MDQEAVPDYYELLQVSCNADTETVESVFRFLAKRYHPDNPQTGDSDRFTLLLEAYRTLKDPEQRAAYDVKLRDRQQQHWQLAQEAADAGELDGDRILRDRLLSLLYVQRRRDCSLPGLGDYELQELLDCPPHLLEFHMWYVQEKGWIRRTESGHFAITVAGVDQAEKLRAPGDHTPLLPKPANDE